MKRIIAIVAGLFLIIILALHYVIAGFLSQKIEGSIRDYSQKGSTPWQVSVKEASISPFLGDINLHDLKVSHASSPTNLQGAQISSDLTYFQLWRFYLNGVEEQFREMQSFVLVGKNLKILGQRTDFTSDYMELRIQKQSNSPRNLESNQTLFESIDSFNFYFYNGSIDRLSTLFPGSIDSLSPNQLTYESIRAEAEWRDSTQTVSVPQFSIHSDEWNLKGNTTFTIHPIQQTIRPGFTNSQLSYKPAFSIAISEKKGGFSGSNLSWKYRSDTPSSRKNFVSFVVGGYHTIQLAEFTWTLPQSLQDKIKKMTGGIGISGEQLEGDSLHINYHFNTSMHEFNLEEFSFTTTGYSVIAQGQVLTDPDNYSDSYIQDGNVKVHHLSDSLRKSIQQFEQFFDLQILNPQDQSIRILIQGDLENPQWKLL